jgi:hypothetical protein
MQEEHSTKKAHHEEDNGHDEAGQRAALTVA